MARIIVESKGGGEPLADTFLKALSVLNDSGFKACAGTKLVSKYAVVVVDDTCKEPAVERLRESQITAAPDR